MRTCCRALTELNICTTNIFAMHHAWSAVNLRGFKDRYDSSVERGAANPEA